MHRDYEALEDRLASCLDTFISVIQEPGNEDDLGNLYALLKGLLEGITTHGLCKLRSDKLKVCIKSKKPVIYDPVIYHSLYYTTR